MNDAPEKKNGLRSMSQSLDLLLRHPPGLNSNGPGFSSLDSPKSRWPDLRLSFAMGLLAVVSEYSGFDLWLAGHVYDPKLGWLYREHWMAETVLHRGGKLFSVAVGVLLLALWGASFRIERLKAVRSSLGRMLVGALGGVITVAVIKNISHIHAPWDLRCFGGTAPYLRMLEPAPLGVGVGHAFPAGHASGGYAFLGFLFMAKAQGWRYRWVMGALAFLPGIAFGAAQQLGGAHFLSHDMITLAICWAWFQFCFKGKED